MGVGLVKTPRRIITERALTIRQFCILENMAVATYYKMRRLGYRPG